MQVAVASVKNIGDAQSVFFAKALDFAHHLRQGGAGNHPVLDDVVGRDAAYGGECGFAAFPHKRALGVGLRDADLPGAIRAADFVNVSHQGFDFGKRAVELYEKQPATMRIIRVDGGFSGLNREVVHHFDGGRKHARGNDAADGGSGFVGGRKRRKQRADAFGALNNAQNDFGGDAERAFRAHKDSREVVARSVERFSCKMDERTIGENHFKAEDVCSGEAVFQAMRAAGIFRDVTADAANRLRGRIRRVEVFLRLDSPRYIKIDDAGFDDDARVGDINFQDAIHAREAEDDTAFNRQRASTEASAGATRDEGNLFAVANADDGLDLYCRRGKQHGAREHAEIRQAVTFVSVEFLRRGDHAVLADDGAEFVEDAGVHRRELTSRDKHAPSMDEGQTMRNEVRKDVGIEHYDDANDGAKRNRVPNHKPENHAFVADLVGGGSSNANRLRIHHLTHHAARAVGGSHQHRIQTQLFRGDALQTAEERVRGSITAGERDAEPSEEGPEKRKEPPGMGKR